MKLELDFTLPLAGLTLQLTHTVESDAIALSGPSGAGKTSVLEVIAGLRKQAKGRVVLDGQVLLDSSRQVDVAPELRRLGYVPQDALLFPHLDVRGNLGFGARTSLEPLISLLELQPLLTQKPSTLSGGQKQRVALGRALATAPRLLLLDEPLSSLDVALKDRIVPWLQKVRAELKLPMLYVTHDEAERRALTTHTLQLERARLV